MKTLFHYLNVTFVTITIILAIVNGEQALTAYFFLGVFQLISAFIMLIIFGNKEIITKEIIIYWIMIILYFSLVINIFTNNTIKFLIIPILIAIYHCYLTFKITKS